MQTLHPQFDKKDFLITITCIEKIVNLFLT